MSIYVIEQVYARCARLPGVAKAVLLVYAFHANEDGRESFPSVAKVTEESGFQKRAVQGAIQSLKEMGLLVVTQESKGGRRSAKGGRNTTTYRLELVNPVPESKGASYAPLDVSGSPEELDSEVKGRIRCTLATPHQMHPSDAVKGASDAVKGASDAGLGGTFKEGEPRFPSSPPLNVSETSVVPDMLPGFDFSDAARYPHANLFERTYYAEMGIFEKLEAKQRGQLSDFIKGLGETREEKMARFKSCLQGFFRDKWARDHMCTVNVLCSDQKVRWLRHEVQPRQVTRAPTRSSVVAALHSRDQELQALERTKTAPAGPLGGLSVDEARRMDEAYDGLTNRDRYLIDAEALGRAKGKNPGLFSGGKTEGLGRDGLIRIERRAILMETEKASRHHADAARKEIANDLNIGKISR